MKSPILPVLVGSSLLLATGCVISVGGRHSPPPPPAPPVVMPPEVVATPGDAATFAEIDASARLDFENGRHDALAAIAARPNLSPAAQVHLINVAYRCLSFDDKKVSVIRQVIANPAFSDPGRQAVVSQLNLLSFDSNRQTLLGAVNDRLAPGQ